MPGVTANIPTGGNASIYEEAVKNMFSVETVPSIVNLSFQSYGKGNFSTTFMENIFFTFKGSRKMREISPDMVIFNGVTTMLCPYFRVAVCTDMQFRVNSILHKYYVSVTYRAFDKVVASSTELKQGLNNQLRVPAEKISVIPVCIDTSKFLPQPKSKRINAILHIGTRPEKSPAITVDAFERIARNDPEIQLLIVGQIDPRVPPLLSRIKQKDKEIRKRISFLGRVSKENLAKLYSSVKVTCVPSDYVIPVSSPTVIESLASGTPVVGSATAISQDILINGYTGFRVRPGDVEQFASKLKIMLENEQLWDEMSKNAMNVAQLCDKANVARRYISLYDNR
jgi:glycosyltransferase involved in cell wall biosynthesis